MNPSDDADLLGNHAKVIRGAWGQWSKLVPEVYKKQGDSHCGMTRWELVGKRGETTGFHLRYFEIKRHGFSSFEKHRHEHAVVVIKGHGYVRLGDLTQAIGPGDVIYVCPNEPHQFSNPENNQPLGFLCIVNADRDAPTLIEAPDQA